MAAEKSIRIAFKSGAVSVAPYSAKFYRELTENIGKDFKAEHASASVNTKDVECAVYELDGKVNSRKRIRIVLKSGVEVLVPYSSKFYAELDENIGKNHKAEHPSATVNTKNIDGIFFEVDSEEIEAS